MIGWGRTPFPIFVLLALGGSGVVGPATAADFTVQGGFFYEDLIWDGLGYTGTVQNLPIRHADVEVVNSLNQQVLASGSTDADGDYSLLVTGQSGQVSLYVRCLASTDNVVDYSIGVATEILRAQGTSSVTGEIHAITTGPVLHPSGNPLLDMGDYLIQDTTGSGVAQAFNILDNTVDVFDYLTSASALGTYPSPAQFVLFEWNGTAGPSGSNYIYQGIQITSTAQDTDGWSDTVILHEVGHWASDMFGNDHNTGGTHYIGDNFQNPLLSYGEGYATFFCAQVREFRASRLNGGGQPVDDHVSIYADLSVPPAGGAPGGLEFAYDFETGLFTNGNSIGQIGTANETNVTSAMWDLVDGVSTPDETPGVDDEPGDETGAFSWDVIRSHMTTLAPPGNWITVEDFYAGWFAVNGSGFFETEIDSAFIGLGRMLFFPDPFEPDDDRLSATLMSPVSYSTSPTGGVVINECDLGSVDYVEVMNTGTASVDLTGWRLKGDRTGFATVEYVFPAFTLFPGSMVVVHEGGSPADNDHVFLYGMDNLVWANGVDGAVTLENSTGTAQDFIRWGGSALPPPPGTGFTGTVGSPPAGRNLGRDESGTDTDVASDLGFVDPTPGAPNAPLTLHTLYPKNDVDFLRLDLNGGDLVGVRAEAPHSAGEPKIELLNAAGDLVAQAHAAHGNSRLAEMQFLVDTPSTYYVRVSHIGLLTDFAPVNLLAFLRPDAGSPGPPVGVQAEPEGTDDLSDPVHLTWLNGSAYDSVEVLRDGVVLDVLPGNTTAYDEAVPRGLYQYSIRGFLGMMATESDPVLAFAGTVDCFLDEDLEGPPEELLLDSPWDRTNAIAAAGSWSLTDSPVGDYGNGLDLSAEIIPPAHLVAFPTLEFDHICITEATWDFGIVEISTDFGTTWIELARFDMDDHPQWNDGSAAPGDWVHETIDLNPYGGENLRIRFRLLTDAYVTEDGWYVDNVTLSGPGCQGVVGVPDDLVSPPALLRVAGPNPFHSKVEMTLSAHLGREATVQVFDAQGRLVRTLYRGVVAVGERTVAWDGRDDSGRGVSAGVYLVRAATMGRQTVQRLVKLP